MNKLAHLQQSKLFLRKIWAYRKNLLRPGSLADDNLLIALYDLEYKANRIANFDDMMQFILSASDNINLCIYDNPAFKEELAALIHRGLVLQGKPADKQLLMKF